MGSSLAMFSMGERRRGDSIFYCLADNNTTRAKSFAYPALASGTARILGTSEHLGNYWQAHLWRVNNSKVVQENIIAHILKRSRWPGDGNTT